MSKLLTQHNLLWVERLARLGYAAKGVVYGIVGVQSARVALDLGLKRTDMQRALQAIVTQPFGKFFLSLVAIGLIGYVLWRFVQAIYNAENKDKNAKGILQRIGYGISGVIYASLALSAVRIVLGSGGNIDSTEDWTARLLAQPFGNWLVGTIGVLSISLAFYEFYQAYTANFCKKLNLTKLSQRKQKLVTGIGRSGLAARGIIFCITGFFLIQAARLAEANKARGMVEVLQIIAQQSYGYWMLGIVGVGLVAYGIYMLIKALYRQFTSS